MITKQEDFISKLIREELTKIDLNNIFNIALDFFRHETIISEIFGIGSYFFRKKDKLPNDVDFVIKLNISFENEDVFEMSDKLEKIKDSFRINGNTLLNVFVIDSENRKLNSVDLWFIKHKGESLKDNIEERKNQIYWNKIKKL